MSGTDARVRLAAFAFLDQQVRLHGSEVLRREVLATGFSIDGYRVPLLGWFAESVVGYVPTLPK